jgi:tripeptidyl-peptidase I
MMAAFLRLALFVALSLSSQVLAQCSTKESVPPPQNWVQQGRPDPEHVLRLSIALPQQNFDELERHLYQVSDPDHERYGQHLSQEEVDELTKPHPESLSAVTEWLTSHGIGEDDVEYSSAKDWMTISVPVRLAEKMLDTTYYVWSHAVSGHSLVRTTQYGLPDHLHPHIETLQPTTSFALFKPHKTTFHFDSEQFDNKNLKTVANVAPIVDTGSGATVDASCNQTITLSCLRQLYNAGNYTASPNVGNSIGVTGYLGENANFADLKLFYADQNPKAVNTTFNVQLVNGGVNSQNVSEAGGEADLDVQFAFGLAFPVNVRNTAQNHPTVQLIPLNIGYIFLHRWSTPFPA